MDWRRDYPENFPITKYIVGERCGGAPGDPPGLGYLGEIDICMEKSIYYKSSHDRANFIGKYHRQIICLILLA
jgi:hypothetical protein